jgi:hypothetical protein
MAIVDMAIAGWILHALGSTVGKRGRSMQRYRSSLITIFCAFIAFVIAGLGLQKMTEYDDFTSVAHHQPVVGIPFDVVYYGSALLLLAVLVGGVPLALAVLRQTLLERRYGIAGLFAVPPIALALFVCFVLLLARANAGSPPADAGSVHANVIAFVLTAIVSTAAVAYATWQTPISSGLYRFAVWPALVATGFMVAMCAATLIAGVGLSSLAPQVMPDMFSYYVFTWWNVTILMGIASLIAIIGAVRLAPIRTRLHQPSSPSLA